MNLTQKFDNKIAEIVKELGIENDVTVIVAISFNKEQQPPEKTIGFKPQAAEPQPEKRHAINPLYKKIQDGLDAMLKESGLDEIVDYELEIAHEPRSCVMFATQPTAQQETDAVGSPMGFKHEVECDEDCEDCPDEEDCPENDE